jgi:hypothetical protein
LLHRPIAKVTTTAPTTQEAAAATEPATQPAIDVQLQRAVDTMTAWVLLQGEKAADAPPATVVPPIAMTITPATEPSTAPTTEP